MTIDENGCIVFSPRSKACPSWPVRIAGMQGLWRYVSPLPRKIHFTITGNENDPQMVEVIGPYFPNNPDRNGGRSRIFPINKVKYAGKLAKPVDVLNVETTAISQRAQRR
jgi:hypothetical protein